MLVFRRRRPALLTLALIGVLAAALCGPLGALHADPASSLAGLAVYVADSTDDIVLFLMDRDGSGGVEPETPGEAIVFYDDSSPGPDLSVVSALLLGPLGELYLLDGGTVDAVLVLTDRDGDGGARGEGEWRAFYDDSSTGPNLNTPQAMAWGPTGQLFLADDGAAAPRILRLLDRDGDGTALGAEEWAVVYDRSALAPPEGPLADLEGLAALEGSAALPGGVLLVSESTVGRLYALRDLTGDGDFLDAGEAALFYDPRGAHPFANLRGLAASAAGVVFAADSTAGLVLRLEDLTGNGDALDPGEAANFLDPLLPGSPGDASDLHFLPDGALLVLDPSRDAVVWTADLDGDRAAAAPGEVEGWLRDGGKLFSSPVAVAVGQAPPLPEVEIGALSPGEGPAGGGTVVQVAGRFPLASSSRVLFGGAEATILATAFHVIECRTPPGRPGPVEVRVVTAAGSASLAGGFRYLLESFIRGDVNADQRVDVSDAVTILAYLFLAGPAPSCQDALDVDDSGRVDITDPIFLLTHLFQGGEAIPLPGPSPGSDPTPDDLLCLPGAAR